MAGIRLAHDLYNLERDGAVMSRIEAEGLRHDVLVTPGRRVEGEKEERDVHTGAEVFPHRKQCGSTMVRMNVDRRVTEHHVGHGQIVEEFTELILNCRRNLEFAMGLTEIVDIVGLDAENGTGASHFCLTLCPHLVVVTPGRDDDNHPVTSFRQSVDEARHTMLIVGVTHDNVDHLFPGQNFFLDQFGQFGLHF